MVQLHPAPTRSTPGAVPARIHDRWAAPAMLLAVLLAVFLAAFRAVASGKPWMIFFEDDFYYYLKIAQNLAHGVGSTFNGIVPTNGYHPLWLLVLTAFSFFSMSGAAIFWFVVAVALLATVATFLLTQNLLEQTGARPMLRNAMAAYLAIYSLHLFYTGMEIILAIPLVFAVMVVGFHRRFWQRGLWQSFLFGLLIAAMILSRLDLSILTALLVLAALLNRNLRQSLTLRQIAGLVLGLLPLAFYFFLNHHLFGTWLPVSGMAKQLRFNHAPTPRAWRTFYGWNLNNWLNLVPIHLAPFVLTFIWKRLTDAQKVIFPAILAFPFVYVGILCIASDWQIWLWYLYPTRAALCVSFIVFSLWAPTGRLIKTPVVTTLVVLLVLGEVAVSKWWTDVQPAIYDAALDIAAFARTHPGTYAMGDRSGMVAYLLRDPLIQTEGLVMDRAFLERIRRQDKLLPTLADYHVRYFIGTSWKSFDGCFHAVEPFQAGKISAHLEGDLCSKPLLDRTHETFQTLLYDLDNEPGYPHQ